MYTIYAQGRVSIFTTLDLAMGPDAVKGGQPSKTYTFCSYNFIKLRFITLLLSDYWSLCQ